VAQWEQLVGRDWKPRLDRALRGELPPAEWPALVRDAVGDRIERRPPYKRDPAAAEAEARRVVERAEPAARQALAAAGVPKDRLAAMSADEAVGTYWCREYRIARDEVWKTWSLPYRQAEPAMQRAWQALAVDRPPAADNPLIQELLLVTGPNAAPVSSAWRARYQFTRIDRHVALLRTLEAVRDYAARHGGRPPDRLEQVTDLPIPPDPFTGTAFPYHFDGRTVVLEAPAPAGHNPRAGWRYELSVGQ
jgi:hypothetical protein